MAGNKLYSILSIFLSGSGSTLNVIALITLYWISNTNYNSQYDQNTGLWERCPDGSHCTSFISTDWVRAVQAFIIISIVVGVGSTVLGIICLKKKVRTCRLFSSIGNLFAAAASLTSVILFGVETSPLPSDLQYGWSFILCCVGSGVYFVAGLSNYLEYHTDLASVYEL